jgi:hypothetical protein
MLWHRDDDSSIVILVVDDKDDDELANVFAREDRVPSSNFGGLWGSGRMDGNWLVAFQLVELGGGLEREWFTNNIHRPLLKAILDVPHLVAIVPEEIAGDARTAEEFAPRFGGALVLEVESRSEPVAQILAERDDG